AEELAEIKHSLDGTFQMDLLRFPIYYAELSNQDILVSEYVQGMSLEEGIEEKALTWDFLLQFFRIHGAYLF
ncbi:MAG TPA: hypothetical protein D7H89_05075, partial [Candidatus Poseidoniales archaeon]